MLLPPRTVTALLVVGLALALSGCQPSHQAAAPSPPPPSPQTAGVASAPDEGTEPEEWIDKVTRQGEPLTLLGQEPMVGEEMPSFSVTANDLSTVTPDSLRGSVLLLISIPSLDTAVCDLETRTFDEKVGSLGDDVKAVVVSMDLPFAQKRWVDAAGVEHVDTASDHREADFGLAYGVLIKDLRLLARAVFVIDREGILRYAQVVPELTDEPDYEAALDAVREALGPSAGGRG